MPTVKATYKNAPRTKSLCPIYHLATDAAGPSDDTGTGMAADATVASLLDDAVGIDVVTVVVPSVIVMVEVTLTVVVRVVSSLKYGISCFVAFMLSEGNIT